MLALLLVAVLLQWCHCVPQFPNCVTYTATNCTQCSQVHFNSSQGYFLDMSTGVCRSMLTCTSPKELNCEPCAHQSCLSDGQPIVCLNSYYLRATPQGLICKTCKTPFCGNCNEAGDCLSCIDGYGFVKDNLTCVPCVKGCQKCTLKEQDSETNSGGDICVLSDSKRLCDICYPGYVYNSVTTRCDIQGPYIGKYIDRNYNLANCSTECTFLVKAGKFCSILANNCIECSDGYYLKRTLADACLPCAASCLTCINETFCTSCRTGVLRYYKCVSACLDAEYFSDAESMCKSCDSACLSCQGNRSFCLACRDPIQYSFNATTGQCSLRCPSGQYMQPRNATEYSNRVYTSGFTTCANCSTGCTMCNASSCMKCSTYYTSQEGVCVSSCGPGFFKQSFGSFYQCMPWQFVRQCSYSGCLNCTNQSVCLGCASNFQLLDGQCMFVNAAPCTNGKWMNELCLSQCPNNTVVNSTNSSLCSCSPSCNKCTYDPNSQQTTCLICADSSWYEYAGTCVSVCPSGTLSVTGRILALVYTVNRCLKNCPEGYKVSGSTCVLNCANNQYSLELYCAQSTPNSYVDYDKLYSAVSPSTISCPSNCTRCVSSNQCLACSTGYYKQNYTNGSILCVTTCQNSDYVVVPNSVVCQPCHYNCTQCVSYLSFNSATGQCSLYCDGMLVANGNRTICQPSRQLLINLYGSRMPNGLYSYLNPLVVEVTNSYSSQASYDTMMLSSQSLASTITSFDQVVPDYYKINITLNQTVLKPNSILNFFVKDEDVVNSTQFSTAPPATASFMLDTLTFQPITGVLNLTVINFNSTGIFAFNYEFYIESLSDPKRLFKTGFANLTTMTNYVILFSIPFTQEDTNIKFTARLFTDFSEVVFIEMLNSTSAAAGLPTGKLNTIDNLISSATTQNISVLTDSFRLVMGEAYLSAPLTNPCSTCSHGICTNLPNNTMTCICQSFYTGRNCQYTTSTFNQVQSIQNKLISFLRSNSRRRLLAPGLTSLDKLQTILAVVSYPDALTPSNLVLIQNSLDGIASVASFTQADIYVQVISYLAAAADSLAMDLGAYLRSKLVTAGVFMKNYLTQPEYKFYKNNVEFRMTNSDNSFKSALLSSSTPLLNFTMALWKASFSYNSLQSGTYMTPAFPYAAAIFMLNTSWYYFETGNGQQINITLQLPVSLTDAQSAWFECRPETGSATSLNGNSCEVTSKAWQQFRLKDPPVVPEKSHGMTVYASLVYATMLALVIVSEVRHIRNRSTRLKIASETGSENNIQPNSRKAKKNRDLDELTAVDGKHDNTIKLDNIPIEKQGALEGQINIADDAQPQQFSNSSTMHLPKVAGPPAEASQNNFTYYHLLKDSLIFPEYLYIILFVVEFECCHLAVVSLVKVSYGIAFIVALVLLAPFYYNILSLISRCCKLCAARRGTPIFLMLALLGVLFIIAVVEYMAFPTNEQFAHWALTLPVFILQAGLKDALIYFYCRSRNDDKHTLANLMRRYVRWQRLMNHVEEIHQEAES